MFTSILVKIVVQNELQDIYGVHVINQSVMYSATGKLKKASDYVKNKSKNFKFMSMLHKSLHSNFKYRHLYTRITLENRNLIQYSM
jgi:hypothetical protein